MANVHLQMTYEERSQRVLTKRQLILSWLRQEQFSNTEILSQVLRISINATRLTLRDMQRDQFVRVEVFAYGAGVIHVWGLTAHGAGMALDPESEDISTQYFEAGRISAALIGHGLDCQKIRLQQENLGFSNWLSNRECARLAEKEGWRKTPDALAFSQDGNRIAIECERTIKSTKRYNSIMADYLVMASEKKLGKVMYFSSIPGLARRLEAIFRSIKQVSVDGKPAALTEKHYRLFSFAQIGEQK